MSAVYQAYVYGTAFWYAIRAQPVLQASGESRDHLSQEPSNVMRDLELYNIWTDGWQLLTIALLLLTMSGLVPLPGSASPASKSAKPYAKALVAVTMLHHVTTSFGAWAHYAKVTHYTPAMGVGVWVNVFLTVAGAVTLAVGFGERGRGRKRA
ncbi:hypothetical protein B0A48_06531 [Cryoendolithus antarcticus]|uniref:Uncharacterized protein n=1 Tax=Cryoendolithus antarcticus TaxID=1507870 RepID=A0A1V8TBP0_9PEZI|nr:hypothetical protein B0A48_06531 [Cryoendolithus antarcticus]